jgi:ABC-type Fe3+-hydroxamate transport system, periplasmic component
MTMITNSSSVPRIPKGQSPPRVYLANWAYRQGVGWTSSQYWPLEAAGGVNVAKEVENRFNATYFEVSREQIVQWDPDVIFIHGYKGRSAAEEILSDPALKSVRAVKEGKVYGVCGPYIGWGSSRVDLQACKLGTGRRFTTS